MPKKRVKATVELMTEIAERMSQGESLLHIVEDDHMPNYSTITRAVIRDEELYDIYRQGRVQQAEYHADRINTLASSPLPTVDAEGKPLDNRWLGAEIQRRKLEVDTLKWTFARTQPHGIRDRKEDAPQQQSITISWDNGEPKAEESSD